MIKPRKTPSRDEYYMGLAFWVAAKSKDPNTQVGAIIVSDDNEPLSSGYNGPPSEIDDTSIDWEREAKKDYIFHAEANAIRYSRDLRLLRGATIYVTGHPCKACMLSIVAEKISKVIYFEPRVIDSGSMLCNQELIAKAREIASHGKVEVRIFSGNLSWMRERMEKLESLAIFR